MGADPAAAAVLGRIVAARAEAEPDRLVFVFENGELPAERVYHRDLAIAGNKLGYALGRAGLEAGQPVAVMLRNHPR